MERAAHQPPIFSKPAINLYAMELFKTTPSEMKERRRYSRSRLSLDVGTISPHFQSLEERKKENVQSSIILASTTAPLFKNTRPMSRPQIKFYNFGKGSSKIAEELEERMSVKERTRDLISKVG